MARLPYVKREELSPEQQAIWDEIARHRGRVGNVFRALLNSPEAGRRVAAVGEYIRYVSGLRPLWREMATLMASRNIGAMYEWAAHLPIARQLGITEQMLAVIEGKEPPSVLPPEEGTIVTYAQELLRERRVSDATFQRALELLGREGLVDLTVLLGYYTMLGLALLAFEVEADTAAPAQERRG